MSFGPGTGVFIKLSSFFVKVHRWGWVKMSMNSKLSGSNGTLSASFKLKKQKDPLHGSNSVKKWRKLLFLWLLSVLTIAASILFLFSFQDGALGRKTKTSDSCEEKAQVLLQHFNVSKTQLHAFVSNFYESDQLQYCSHLFN